MKYSLRDLEKLDHVMAEAGKVLGWEWDADKLEWDRGSKMSVRESEEEIDRLTTEVQSIEDTEVSEVIESAIDGIRHDIAEKLHWR